MYKMEPFEETRLVKITVLAKPYENAQIMVRVEEATQKTGFRRHSGKMKTALLVLGHWTEQTVLRRGTIVTEANYKPSVTVKLTGHRADTSSSGTFETSLGIEFFRRHNNILWVTTEK